MGQEWASPVFLHSDYHLHKIDALSFQGGERMGRSSSSQNCLLVTRQNDNHSPGPGPGRLVPSSHQRSELSNTILCTFSRGDKRASFSPPHKKQWLYAYSWQGKFDAFTCQGGKRMDWPTFSADTDNYLLMVEWGKNGLAKFFRIL